MSRAWLLLLAGCPEPVDSETVTLSWEDGSTFQIDRYEFPNARGAYPTHTTDLATAVAACEKVGRRLCTAREWRRACLGPEGQNRYGYGPRHIPRACHTEVALPSGHTSMFQPATMVSAAGAYLQCRTPEGVYDLVGNLEEWVLDDWRGLGGALEGGAWYTATSYADCTGRYSREPDYRLNPTQPVFSAGFRCCLSDDEPTAASVSPEHRAADSRSRLALARQGASTAPYEPDDEAPLAGGGFMDRYEYPNRRGERPLVAVTWEEAQQRCAEAGKRLCSTVEWERACTGGSSRAYPYGDVYVPSACAVDLVGPSTSGRFLACTTEGGLADLVGSAWEWTDTPLDVGALRVREGEVFREIRGGSWFVDPSKGLCRPVDGYPAAPQDQAFTTLGFRCCRGEAAVVDDTRAEPGPGDCPAGMVGVGDFCIDTYEHPNLEGGIPRGNLDWPGAVEACSGRGLRVCAEAEWERACAGSGGRRWPYGDVFEAGRCFLRDQPKLVGRVDAAASGTWPACRTPEGVFDLSGNLWEWVRTEPARPGHVGAGVLRGGGWDFSAGLGQCRARATPTADFSLAQVGVRCCSTPAHHAPVPR